MQTLTIETLLDISEKAKQEKDFNTRWEMEKPLRQWANSELIKAAKLKNITNAQEMKRHLVNIDNQAFLISKEEMNQLAILFEDDAVKVVTWLDYDLDTTLCKYTVYDKRNNLSHRDMIDIENSYSLLY